MYGFLCLLPGLRDDHALAKRQTIRFYHHRDRVVIKVGTGSSRVGKDCVARSRDIVFVHQLLGKRLAGLNDRRLCVRAEAGHACGGQGVHRPQRQRVIRRHYGIIDAMGLCKCRLRGDVLRADLRHANGIGGYAAVSRQAVDHLYRRVLPELFDNGVLTPAAANNQELHSNSPQMK